MTSDRLKSLARTRLILSVIAVFLAGLMIVSGVMHFVTKAKGPEGSTEPTGTVATTPAETTGAAETIETTSPSETTEVTETTEAAEITDETIDPRDAAAQAGSHGPSESVDKDTAPNSPTPETPKEETPKEETPKEETPKEENPKEENPKEENPKEETPKEENPKEETPKEETPKEETPKEETPKEETPKEETPKEETPEPEKKKWTPPWKKEKNTSLAASHTISSQPASLALAAPVETISVAQLSETGDTSDAHPESNLWAILFWSSAALLAADLLAILLLSRKIQEEKKRLRRVRKSLAHTDAHAQNPGQAPRAAMQPVNNTEMTVTATRVGTIHQMGRREYQQDSLGHTAVLNNRGLLAVVADGMGGLSGGEKVSQKIVMDTLALGHQLQPGQANGALWKMLDTVNANVNRALGPDGLYKSGSTLIAVLVYDGRFQWISVGDSRIYLYRQGYASQVNQDHDQLQVWMADVLSGRRTMEETLRNPDGRKLTSFIGMGQLKYVDGSRGAIALEPGDRLVLMSDGVYNIIPEDRLADVLKRYPDPEQAASILERMICDSNHPHQDNFTAIILGF